MNSAPAVRVPGELARQQKGWLPAHRWLLTRRVVQTLILGLFLLGPWAGVWVLKGNLSSSRLLDVVPLSDPFVLLQTMAAGHWPELSALTGGLIVVVFYFLAGGRSFCSWVCPVNPVTDLAAWLRRRLRIGTGRTPDRHLRHALLAAALLGCAITGTTLWESVNPVSLTQRALIFGGLTALWAVGVVFVFDLLIAQRGWCGHLCPHGALYALIGRGAVLRVSAQGSSRCHDCGDCYAVCPEAHVIMPALKARDGHGPVITNEACTNCGRCVDVCSTHVFRFTHRWDKRRN